MNYQRQIQKVMDFIGQNIDVKLTLNQLSDVACFSKYHFHRLFKIHTGLSLQQYIRWLRLKRAAHQLLVHQDEPIINIAMNAGFGSHEGFSRSFKQVCGQSPQEFRAQMSWHAWEKPAYHAFKQGTNIMNVVIKEMKKRRLAVLEHRGDPNKIADSVQQLISWSRAQPMDLKPRPGEAFGFGYDDPKTTPTSEFRTDLAITIPEHTKVSGKIIERYLPAGRYAVAVHKGSRHNIDKTVYALYRDWLPTSGESLGDLPCIFSYYNFEHEVAETELITECRLFLK